MSGSVAVPHAEVAEPGPQPSGSARYRAADLEIFPAGDGLSLVYARDSQAAAFYRADVLGLLASCRDFRTIDQHVRDYLAQAAPGVRASELRREIVRLAGAGFLVSTDGLGQLTGAGSAPSSPVSTIAIPTCDRVQLLRRAVSGYAANCARYGRHVDVVVADDSAGAATRTNCRAVLGELARRLDVGMFYAGLEEKSGFVSRLARYGGIPEEVVRFCCLPDRHCGVTIGANRNVLLLHTAGERIFSADDDTVCRVAVPPGRSGESVLTPAITRLTCGSSRAGTRLSRPCDMPRRMFSGATASTWARRPHRCLPPRARSLSSAAIRRCCDRYRAPASRIRVTANGVVGDCGWDNPDFHLFQDGATFARLVSSPDGYRMARATREMIQGVPMTTVTARADPKFAMCMGLDNTGLLPPFPPVGRAEEVAFCAVLAVCFRPASRGSSADAPAARSGGREAVLGRGGCSRSASGLGYRHVSAGLIPASLRHRPRGYDPRAFPDRYRPPAGGSFDEFARLIAWDSMSTLIGGLEERLAARSPPGLLGAGCAAVHRPGPPECASAGRGMVRRHRRPGDAPAAPQAVRAVADLVACHRRYRPRTTSRLRSAGATGRQIKRSRTEEEHRQIRQRTVMRQIRQAKPKRILMDSKLFAFRVARPIEAIGDSPLEFTYDPRSQTAVWSGSGTAIASLYCSNGGTHANCNGYANYCTTWGGRGTRSATRPDLSVVAGPGG